LKAAGYDPSAALDLFSKLAYEHPPWAKAILPEVLIALRVDLESDVLPESGYRTDTSEFVKHQATVVAKLGHGNSKRQTENGKP
jgi:hypothetical protein